MPKKNVDYARGRALVRALLDTPLKDIVGAERIQAWCNHREASDKAQQQEDSPLPLKISSAFRPGDSPLFHPDTATVRDFLGSPAMPLDLPPTVTTVEDMRRHVAADRSEQDGAVQYMNLAIALDDLATQGTLPGPDHITAGFSVLRTLQTILQSVIERMPVSREDAVRQYLYQRAYDYVLGTRPAPDYFSATLKQELASFHQHQGAGDAKSLLRFLDIAKRNTALREKVTQEMTGKFPIPEAEITAQLKDSPGRREHCETDLALLRHLENKVTEIAEACSIPLSPPEHSGSSRSRGRKRSNPRKPPPEGFTLRIAQDE